MKKFILPLSFLVAASMATNASAITNSANQVQTTISVAKYNLTTQAGAHAAYSHIRSEAKKACGHLSGAHVPLKVTLVQKACVADMINSAISQLDTELLNNIHEQKKATG